jgi:hypothetical protein
MNLNFIYFPILRYLIYLVYETFSLLNLRLKIAIFRKLRLLQHCLFFLVRCIYILLLCYEKHQAGVWNTNRKLEKMGIHRVYNIINNF